MFLEIWRRVQDWDQIVVLGPWISAFLTFVSVVVATLGIASSNPLACLFLVVTGLTSMAWAVTHTNLRPVGPVEANPCWKELK